MKDHGNNDGDKPGGDVLSKTRRKQNMHELQELGERLTELNDTQLAALDIPDELREAAVDARRITKHEARRRHMQYIGKLMRSVDPSRIRDRMAEWDGVSVEATAALHHIERWRDQMVEDDAALAKFMSEHPRADSQRLRAMIRSVREDRAAGRPARQFRELFRELRRTIEAAPTDY